MQRLPNLGCRPLLISVDAAPCSTHPGTVIEHGSVSYLCQIPIRHGGSCSVTCTSGLTGSAICNRGQWDISQAPCTAGAFLFAPFCCRFAFSFSGLATCLFLCTGATPTTCLSDPSPLVQNSVPTPLCAGMPSGQNCPVGCLSGHKLEGSVICTLGSWCSNAWCVACLLPPSCLSPVCPQSMPFHPLSCQRLHLSAEPSCPGSPHPMVAHSDAAAMSRCSGTPHGGICQACSLLFFCPE